MNIVDCDAHVLEPANLWQTYLEPKYRDRAIRIEEHDGVEKLIIGEEVVLEGVVAGLGGAEADKADFPTCGTTLPTATTPTPGPIAWTRGVSTRR